VYGLITAAPMFLEEHGEFPSVAAAQASHADGLRNGTIRKGRDALIRARVTSDGAEWGPYKGRCEARFERGSWERM
jgi:hypothetical protein